MEGLLLVEDSDAKQSEAWPEIGKPIVKETSQATPLIILVMPSISQDVEIADLVAFVVHSHDANPTTSSRIRKRVPVED